MAKNTEQHAESAAVPYANRDMKRASDLGATEPEFAPADKLRNLVDRDLVLNAFYPGESRFGRYYRLEMVDPNTGEVISAFTSHKYVVQFLDRYEAAAVCPLVVTFYLKDAPGGKRVFCIR